MEFIKVVEFPTRPRISLCCFETTPSIQVYDGTLLFFPDVTSETRQILGWTRNCKHLFYQTSMLKIMYVNMSVVKLN